MRFCSPYSAVADLVWYRAKALAQLAELPIAPSVGMHEVPRESVGQHLGFGKDEEEGRDSLDASVARESILMATLRQRY